MFIHVFIFFFLCKLIDKTNSIQNVKATITTWPKLFLMFISVYTLLLLFNKIYVFAEYFLIK